MKVVLLAAAAIAVAGLALTLSRGGIVGAGISLAVLLAWAPFRRYAGAILLVLSLFALANLGSLHDSSASPSRRTPS